MDKLAIYDFCQTLVDFETADQFVHFVRKNTNNTSMLKKENCRLFFTKIKLLPVLNKIFHRLRKTYSLNKSIILFELKGFTRDEIDKWSKRYYDEVIKKHLIHKTVSLIEEQKQSGYCIAIVSASYEPIVKHFVKEYGVDLLVTNDFRYNSRNEFTGKLKRADCVGINKVKRLKEVIPNFNCNAMKDCLSYGDSYSDLPILKIAKKGYVVTHDTNKEWIKENNLEELRW